MMQYIGFTTKYYTLWNVETRGNYTYYDYVQNLSIDFEKAKAKRPNALVDLTLRGHHSYRVKNTIPTDCFLFGRYKNQPIVEHTDDIDYLAWYHNHVDAETYKEKAKNILKENGYKELNGKMYNDKDYNYQLMLIKHFPIFKNKIENNLPFKFKSSKNISLGYNDNEEKIGILNIAYCKLIFNNIVKKEYNNITYYLPLNINGYEIRIKGYNVCIDEYIATPIDDMNYQINVIKFHTENI